MNAIDLLILILLVGGLLRGLYKGLFLEVASLIGFICALYGAFHFAHVTTPYLEDWTQLSGTALYLASFLITFFLIAFGIHLVGKLLTKLASITAMGWLNRILGGLFGVVKMFLVAAALSLLVYTLNEKINVVDKELLKESKWYRITLKCGQSLFQMATDDFQPIPLEEKQKGPPVIVDSPL